MDETTFRLIELMREDFGELGPFLLSKEIKEMGCKDIVSMTQAQKEILVERIITNVFATSMSAQKLIIKRNSLESIFREEETRKLEMSEREKTQRLLGMPRIDTGITNEPLKQAEPVQEKNVADVKQQSKRAENNDSVTFVSNFMTTQDTIKDLRPEGAFNKKFMIALAIVLVLFMLFVMFGDLKSDNTGITVQNRNSAKDTSIPSSDQQQPLPSTGFNASSGDVNNNSLDRDNAKPAADQNSDQNAGSQNTNPMDLPNDPANINPSMQSPSSLENALPNMNISDVSNLSNLSSLSNKSNISNLSNVSGTPTTNVSSLESKPTDAVPTTATFPQSASPNGINNNDLDAALQNASLQNQTMQINITNAHVGNESSICDMLRQGTIYFNPADSHFYGCNGRIWLRLDN
jgi:hypothetical protein